MLIYSIDWMKNGWFIGDFYPTAFPNTDFEIGHLKHKAGEKSDGHYHKISTEINYLIKGHISFDTGQIVNGKKWVVTLGTGAIWVTLPNEIYNIEFLEDSELIVVKTPSKPGDKHYPSESEHSEP